MDISTTNYLNGTYQNGKPDTTEKPSLKKALPGTGKT